MVAGWLVFLSGCKGDEPITPSLTTEVKLTEHSTLGSILVDGNGYSLYFFANDTKGTSACTDGCLDTWPIFYVESLEVGSGLNGSDFAEITREDGSKQTTYKGWPLYYYAPESDGQLEEAGATGGEGVNSVWYVAKPDYTIMMANAQLVGHDGKHYTSSYAEGDGLTPYFVDGEGRTLYTFINDAEGYNSFTAADLSNNGVWPIFYDELQAIPSTLNESDFGSIMVYGEMQLTYKGWPLYYFGQDMDKGDNKGISFPMPGVWPVPNAALAAAPAYTGATVKLMSNDDFGSIITDHKGQTLYFFANDTKGTNNCTGGCANLWPVFHADVRLAEGSELNMADFGEITLADGTTKQTTYKGWPLYYYSPAADGVLEDAGQTEGENFNGVWFVAKHDYSLMMANAQLVGHDGENYTNDYSVGDGLTKYFVDANGRTIYRFINDTKDNNNFTASDLSNNGVWPIFYTDIDNLPTGLNADDFDEIDVFGNKQLTYKGHPLYYFGQDADRGDNKGISFPAAGVWPIVNLETQVAASSVTLTNNSTFGQIMTDAKGRTLYFFANDANGMNNCSGGCANLWPTFYTDLISLAEGSELDLADFGVITLADGTTKQTTYKGWPLYYYSPTADGVLEATGTVSGDGFNNVWYVAKHTYGLMTANTQLVGHDGKNYTSEYVEGTGATMYFTDANGRTVYIFTNDTKDDNNFTASDFSNNGVWPIFHVNIEDLPSSMDRSEFGEIDVFGEKQLTFRGWPLYYFGQDANRGENKGVSFPAPGVWPIANNTLAPAQ